jgi:hypothetical protein
MLQYQCEQLDKTYIYIYTTRYIYLLFNISVNIGRRGSESHPHACLSNIFLTLGHSTIETKEADRIGYSGFLVPHEYSGEGQGT